MASNTDESWSVKNINLLIQKRIENDGLFETANSGTMGWVHVVVAMKKSGGSKTLSSADVEKQWSKLCETYKKLTENQAELEKEIKNYPYFQKLHSYFVDKCLNIKRKINATDYYKNKSSTELLIDRRIARNYLFEKAGGRRCIESPWRVVHKDLMKLGEPEETTPVHLKNRWYSLVAKYKKLKNENDEAKEWRHFTKLEAFFNKAESDKKFDEFHTPDCTSNQKLRKIKRWTVEQTRLLIEWRIKRKAIFERRARAFYGWQLVLSDLKKAGVSNDFNSYDVQKKWNSLCNTYKIIMDQNCSNPRWIYFKQMHEYLKEKYYLREKKVKDSKKLENMSTEYTVIVDFDLEREKKSKCRLCQQNKIDHSLFADETLCERIIKCTSLRILKNATYLPQGVCDICKTTIDTFYEFLTRCRGVDSTLRTNIPVLNIQTICSSTEVCNMYECAECFTTFTSIDMLEIHLKSHDKSFRFQCKLAAKEQNNENTMDCVNNSDMTENESGNIDNVETNINTETSDQYKETTTNELIELIIFK